MILCDCCTLAGIASEATEFRDISGHTGANRPYQLPLEETQASLCGDCAWDHDNSERKV